MDPQIVQNAIGLPASISAQIGETSELGENRANNEGHLSFMWPKISLGTYTHSVYMSTEDELRILADSRDVLICTCV